MSRASVRRGMPCVCMSRSAGRDGACAGSTQDHRVSSPRLRKNACSRGPRVGVEVDAVVFGQPGGEQVLHSGPQVRLVERRLAMLEATMNLRCVYPRSRAPPACPWRPSGWLLGRARRQAAQHEQARAPRRRSPPSPRPASRRQRRPPARPRRPRPPAIASSGPRSCHRPRAAAPGRGRSRSRAASRASSAASSSRAAPRRVPLLAPERVAGEPGLVEQRGQPPAPPRRARPTRG